ncbi:MAG: sulfur carrier protein ThiS adenylyltransferase ThiF [Desulfobacteraceae bacterium]
MIRIGIAGAGGIGSNVAAALARSGAEELRIADFDRVEASNLDRQFYTADQVGNLKTGMLKNNLVRINPALNVECLDTKIDCSNSALLFDDCSCVVEGMDTLSDKRMFVETMARTGRHVVAASGIAGPSLQGIRVKRLANCHIVGDFESDVQNLPVNPEKVLAVSFIMAGIIIRKFSFNQKRNHER